MSSESSDKPENVVAALWCSVSAAFWRSGSPALWRTGFEALWASVLVVPGNHMIAGTNRTCAEMYKGISCKINLAELILINDASG